LQKTRGEAYHAGESQEPLHLYQGKAGSDEAYLAITHVLVGLGTRHRITNYQPGANIRKRTNIKRTNLDCADTTTFLATSLFTSQRRAAPCT